MTLRGCCELILKIVAWNVVRLAAKWSRCVNSNIGWTFNRSKCWSQRWKSSGYFFSLNQSKQQRSFHMKGSSLRVISYWSRRLRFYLKHHYPASVLEKPVIKNVGLHRPPLHLLDNERRRFVLHLILANLNKRHNVKKQDTAIAILIQESLAWRVKNSRRQSDVQSADCLDFFD